MGYRSFLEICAYGAESVMIASQAGADRVELCDNMQEGGTTPSAGTILVAAEVPNIEVHVIIRPRGGDFCYSDSEFETMKQDVRFCKNTNITGMVFGILLPDGTIDTKRCEILMREAGNKQLSFHRAFDMSKNPLKNITTIKNLGFIRILSSGTYNTVDEGLSILEQFQQEANKQQIQLMAGSGVNIGNIDKLYKIGICHFHTSAMKEEKTAMIFQNSKIKMGKQGGLAEFSRYIADKYKIRAIREKLNQLDSNC